MTAVRAGGPGSTRVPTLPGLERGTVALVLLALLVGAASVGYPRTTLDSPASTYVGATILDGGVPYRDAWDLRAPGVYFAYALNIALFGKSAIAMRVFDLLWQFGTAGLILLIARRAFPDRRVALLAAGLYVAGYYSQHYSTWAQPDGYLNLPMALSFWFGLRAIDTDRALDWVGAAFGVGLACLFKLPFGLFGIALLAASIMAPAAGLRRRLTRMGALAIGVATALLACVAYFLANGALGDLVDAQFRFAPAYVSRIHSAVTFGDVLAQFRRPILIPFFLLLVVGLGSGVSAVGRRGRAAGVAALLLAWLAVGGFTILLQGSYLLYHLLPLLPPLALLAAPRLSAARAGAGEVTMRARALVVGAAAVFVLVTGAKLVLDARFTIRELTRDGSSDIWLEPGLALKRLTTPEDRIFVWGNVPALYIHADRRAGCRFLPTAFLSVDAPGLDFRGSCLQELRQRRPKYIVLVPDGPITPGLSDTRTSYDEFPGLKELVATEYELAERDELVELYRRK